MRILVVHNEYRVPSGEAAVVEQEIELLARHGHIVVRYGRSNQEITGLVGLSAAWRAIWNHQSYRAVRDLIRSQQIEICHIHNTFPLLSPSVFWAARVEGVAVVHTLHNYRWLCPAATFFRKGKLCTACLAKLPWRAVVHGCYRGSRLASGVAAASVVVHRWLRTHERCVDMFVALSEHARSVFLRAGFPEDRIVVKGNFLSEPPREGRGGGQYILYVGRLAPEKGVVTLLGAWTRHKPPLRLKIVGDGPLLPQVLAAARTGAVEYLGRVSRAASRDLMAEAYLVVVPSEWYEPFGMTVVEALSVGTPVLAAAEGALRNLVKEGKTGLFFGAGDEAALAERVRWAAEHPAEVSRMRQEAFRAGQQWCNSELAYSQLLRVYRLARVRAAERRSVGCDSVAKREVRL